MLVLSRRVGEILYLNAPDGTEIAIAIVGNHNNQTRVGLVYPDGWNVQRGEQRHPDVAKRAQILQLKRDK